MEIQYPDTNKLQIEYLKNWGREFLNINNLKLGDIVVLDFEYDTLRSTYKSREMTVYSCKEKTEGILKIDKNGILYAESIKDMKFYFHKSNGRKSGYESVIRKSIIKFGSGFISHPRD